MIYYLDVHVCIWKYPWVHCIEGDFTRCIGQTDLIYFYFVPSIFELSEFRRIFGTIWGASPLARVRKLHQQYLRTVRLWRGLVGRINPQQICRASEGQTILRRHYSSSWRFHLRWCRNGTAVLWPACGDQFYGSHGKERPFDIYRNMEVFCQEIKQPSPTWRVKKRLCPTDT